MFAQTRFRTEKLLKNLRSGILAYVSSKNQVVPDLLRFQSALALQCFTNEYVISETKEDKKNLKVVEAAIIESFKNNEQPDPQERTSQASFSNH